MTECPRRPVVAKVLKVAGPHCVSGKAVRIGAARLLIARGGHYGSPRCVRKFAGSVGFSVLGEGTRCTRVRPRGGGGCGARCAHAGAPGCELSPRVFP